MKLCSFIMPTRNASFQTLGNAVLSILQSSPQAAGDLEILLRVDDDDTDRIPYAQGLVNGSGRVVVGPRGSGYTNMGAFVSDLLSVADSQWCWLFDDDAWVEGDWFTPLSELDTVCAVNSQFYCLGDSIYPNNGSGEGCGIIIPTTLARSLGPCLPVDGTWLGAVKSNGWPFVIMEGVSYHHDGRARC